MNIDESLNSMWDIDIENIDKEDLIDLPTISINTPAYGIVYGAINHTVQDAEAVLNNEFYGRMLNTTAQNNGIMIHTAEVYYLSYQVTVGPNQNGCNILFGEIRAAEYHTQFSTNDHTSVGSGGG